MRRIHRSAAFLAAGLALAACNDVSFQGPTPEVIDQVTFDASLNIDLTQMTKTSSGLYYQDLVVGTGVTPADGDSVTVSYTGWLRNAYQFDSGSFGFYLGQGQVIPGFDEGVHGMAVGGKRKLIMPSSLGYGDFGSGPIPGGAILIFDVELLSVD